MDESNVHTSVVIELANQIDSDGQKMYQIDFNDMNPSKDYVIDQIFCGENVTVYALFEMEDDGDRQETLNSGFQKTTTTNDNSSELNETSDKSYSKTEYVNDLKILDNDEVMSSKEISRKESFYCLQQYLEDSELEEENSGMKVLYTKEAILRSQKLNGQWMSAKKTPTESKGVNTDIALCPKLLDEVQKVIKTGFALGKQDGKKGTSETHIASPKLSTSFINSNVSSSASSLNLVRKPSPNFLLVPLVMTEEGLLKQFRNESLKTADTKLCSSEKDNGETANQENKTSDVRDGEVQKVQKKESTSGQTCTCKCQSEEAKFEEHTNELENLKNIFSRHSILDEIKGVQWKLNSIIQTLESKVPSLTKTELNKSREAVKECFTKISQDKISRNLDEKASELQVCVTVPVEKQEKVLQVPEFVEEEVKPVEKSAEQPFLTSVSHLPPSNGSQRKKKLSSSSDRMTTTQEMTASSSNSTTSTTSTYNTFSLRNILERSNENLKEDFDSFDQQESSRSKPCKTWRVTSVSKSDSNIRLKTCVDFKSPLHPVLKKSQSLDLRQEKSDGFASRKLKSVSHNLDNSLKMNKANGRTHPFPAENSLPNGLTPNMGDELNVKEKFSKAANSDFDLATLKEEALVNTLKRNILAHPTTKTQIENEKLLQKSPKNRLTLPQLLYKNDKMTVQYCDSTASAETNLKSGKNSPGSPEKLGVKSLRKAGDTRKKTIGDKEKTTSIYSRQRLNVVESSSRRDIPFARDVKKTTPRRPVEKPVVRTDRKEMFDVSKKQLLYRAVKSVVRANPDSKLHIDKLVKSAMENYTEPKTGRLTKEVKTVEKIETLSSRPPSQKRQRGLAANTTSSNESKDKSSTNFFRKNSRPSTADKQKGSLERLLQKEKAEQILVFDKKLDDVFVAKKIQPETSVAQPLKDLAPEPEAVVQEEQQQPVVVELYSKKPPSVDECISDDVPESLERNSPGSISSYPTVNESKTRKELPEINIMNDEDAEKAIVKSVWALTKVLLYGDGTKKFEILEASLSPPDYSLKNENNNTNKHEAVSNR